MDGIYGMRWGWAGWDEKVGTDGNGGMDGIDGMEWDGWGRWDKWDGAARDRTRWDGTGWAATGYGDTERHQLGRGGRRDGAFHPPACRQPPSHPPSCYWEPRQLYWPPSTSAGTPAPTATPGRVPRAP